MALASCIGATIVTLPRWPRATASALMPSEWTPSSLVTRISRIGIFDCIGGNEEQQHGRHGCERGARHECDGRAKVFVQVAEQDTCDERATTQRSVVHPEGGATPIARREIGHQRFLGPLGEREID